MRYTKIAIPLKKVRPIVPTAIKARAVLTVERGAFDVEMGSDMGGFCRKLQPPSWFGAISVG